MTKNKSKQQKKKQTTKNKIKKSMKRNKFEKPIKKNKPKIVILDTNICNKIYGKMDEKYLNKKLLKELSIKFNTIQKAGELYIVEAIKKELDLAYIKNDRELLQKIWKIFNGKVLKNSYEHVSQVDEICKKMLPIIKNEVWVQFKIDNRRKCNQSKYNDAEKKFKKYLPRWKNGESNFDFYLIVKDYDMKKRTLELGKRNEDQLLIEFPDRIILSTAIFYAKLGNNVSLYTNDKGILCLSEEMKKVSVTIQNIYPKSSMHKRINTKKRYYNTQLTSNMTSKEADDLEDEFLDNYR